MKKAIIIIATVLLAFATAIGLISYKSIPEQGVGIDLPFGWVQPESSMISQGALCTKGTDPYVMGLPFYASKHDGVLSCGSGMSNIFALLLDIITAIGLVGLVGFVIHKLLKTRRK